MKKWFYRNVVLVYVLAWASITIGVLCYIYSIVSAETYNALFSLALVINFMVVVSTVFVGILGENKLEEIEKGEEVC